MFLVVKGDRNVMYNISNLLDSVVFIRQLLGNVLGALMIIVFCMQEHQLCKVLSVIARKNWT